MDPQNLPLSRLAVQGLNAPTRQRPAQALDRLLAIQGQDYAGGKWSLGLRLAAATDAEVEQAIERSELVRTWAMRGTLHLVAAADLRWLLALVGPGVIAGNPRRYRELELDEPTLRRSTALLAEALAGGKRLDRPALFAMLERHGVSTRGQRGVYMLQRASLEGVICQGATRRNQPTFYRIDEALPPTPPKAEDEALAELARRYFSSRGPATLQDFIWWTGFGAARARRALDAARPALEEAALDGIAFWRAASVPAGPAVQDAPHILLLPGFDEYLLSYKDRSAMMDVSAVRSLPPASGMPPNTLVIDGLVCGVWKRTVVGERVRVRVNPFRPLAPAEDEALLAAARRYAEFLGKNLMLKQEPLPTQQKS